MICKPFYWTGEWKVVIQPKYVQGYEIVWFKGWLNSPFSQRWPWGGVTQPAGIKLLLCIVWNKPWFSFNRSIFPQQKLSLMVHNWLWPKLRKYGATASGPATSSCLAAYQFEICRGLWLSSSSNETFWKQKHNSCSSCGNPQRNGFEAWEVICPNGPKWLVAFEGGWRLCPPLPSSHISVCVPLLKSAGSNILFPSEWWNFGTPTNAMWPNRHLLPLSKFQPPLPLITWSSLRRARRKADVAVGSLRCLHFQPMHCNTGFVNLSNFLVFACQILYRTHPTS